MLPASPPPAAIPAAATPAPIAATLLPDGNHTYQSPGRRGRTDDWTVTVYRRGAAVVISWSGVTSVMMFNGPAGHAQFVNQPEDLVSDTTLGANLQPIAYGYTYKLGFERSYSGVVFSKDGAEGLGRRRGGKAQLIAPSTAWVGLSPSDVGSLAALPAELSGCSCTAASVADLDSSKIALYNITKPADLARPADVPDADMPIVFSGEKQITEWYDPQTLLPDYIAVQGGITLHLKR